MALFRPCENTATKIQVEFVLCALLSLRPRKVSLTFWGNTFPQTSFYMFDWIGLICILFMLKWKLNNLFRLSIWQIFKWKLKQRIISDFPQLQLKYICGLSTNPSKISFQTFHNWAPAPGPVMKTALEASSSNYHRFVILIMIDLW